MVHNHMAIQLMWSNMVSQVLACYLWIMQHARQQQLEQAKSNFSSGTTCLLLDFCIAELSHTLPVYR